MAHTYSAKLLNVYRTSGRPGVAGAYMAAAEYTSSTGTLAETIAAIAASSDAAAKLPVGSHVRVKVLTGGSENMESYLVTANTGSAITLLEEKIA